MLWGIIVAEFERLLDAGYVDDVAFGDGLAHDIDSIESPSLRIYFFLDCVYFIICEVDCDEDDLRVDPVFCLGEQIGCYETGVACFIRDDLRGGLLRYRHLMET